MSLPLQDSELIYSCLSEDEDLREIVALFVNEMPSRIAKIEEEFSSQSWSELERTVHQLKGAAGSYGFAQLSPAAGALESLIRDEADLKEITEAKDNLVQLCKRITADAPNG